MPPGLSPFAEAAAELRRQEIARLSNAVLPRLDQLRGMTPPVFPRHRRRHARTLGHGIIIEPSAPELVTVKAGRKFATECAPPANLAPAGRRDLVRLNDAVVTANAVRGFFIIARAFSAEAEGYAKGAPLDLVDGARLIKALYRLPLNEGRITLRREPIEVPALIGEGDSGIVPFRAGETLRWRLAP
jgi:hypothetical protein